MTTQAEQVLEPAEIAAFIGSEVNKFMGRIQQISERLDKLEATA